MHSEKKWHSLEAETILDEFHSDLHKGLNQEQFAKNRELYGRNLLSQKDQKSKI
jgi:hypothetical protein